MARAPGIAKLLEHIAACRNAALPGRRLPVRIGAALVGYADPAYAGCLAAADSAVSIAGGQVAVAPEAAPRLNHIARAAGSRFRNEDFDVRGAVDGPVLAQLDRGALPDWGVIGVGVHLNGLVRRADGWHLWIGKRATDKKLDPGKLDHLVAGGVAAGMSRLATLIKEAGEEASLPPELVAQAREVARFDYAMERDEGLRRDVVFAYDLVLPHDFTPRPNDNEVEHFELWPLQKALEVAATTNNFKFNVNLVLIDLFIRHNLITGEPATSLRQALAPAAPK